MKNKRQQVFIDLWLTIKRANICVIEIQEKDARQKNIGIMIEISPNLVETINLQNLKKKKKMSESCFRQCE